MRRAVVLGLACAVATSALAQVSPQTLLRERVVSMLDAPRPVTSPARWRAVGPGRDTNALLIDIAQRAAEPLRRRARAVEALAFFSTKATHQVLWQLVEGPRTPGILRKLALRSLGGAFGEQVLFDLEARLRDDDPYVRAGAALGLALVGDHRVRAMLEAALFAEPDLDVRLVIDEALARVRARERAAAPRPGRAGEGAAPAPVPGSRKSGPSLAPPRR